MIEKESVQAQFKIYERLSRLDEETQERISQKYYHGTRPWLRKGEPARKRRRRTKSEAEQEE